MRLTVKEYAKQNNVSLWTVYERINKGLLVVRPGGRKEIDLELTEKHLDKLAVEQAEARAAELPLWRESRSRTTERPRKKTRLTLVRGGESDFCRAIDQRLGKIGKK